MSASDEKDRRALTVRPTRGDYEVGYSRPPAETRFKPGQSGNPRGRPRGSKNRPKSPALNEERLKKIILDEAYRTITVNEANRVVSIPMAQAVIRSMAVNAAKGHQRAQRMFTQLLSTTERENKRLNDEVVDRAMTYKIAWDRELERRNSLGVVAPDPIPHPDHVIIDMNKGTAHIRGPTTKEEKRKFDAYVHYRGVFAQELIELRAELEDQDDPYREQVKAEIAHTENVLRIVEQLIRIGRIPDEMPALGEIVGRQGS